MSLSYIVLLLLCILPLVVLVIVLAAVLGWRWFSPNRSADTAAAEAERTSEPTL